MDLLRSIAKCFFCDYSIDNAYDQIRKEVARSSASEGVTMSDYVKGNIVRLLAEREPQYNAEAIVGIVRVAESEWFDKEHNLSIYGQSFCLLDFFCDNVFKDKSKLLINFEDLLKWKDMSLYLGEDFLTCVSLAKFEVEEYGWPSCHRHDFEELNSILDKGLFDLHVHQTGGIDTAELLWVKMMNQPAYCSNELSENFKQSQNESFCRFWQIEKPLTLRQWILYAGKIRKVLYYFIQGHSDFDKVEELVCSEIISNEKAQVEINSDGTDMAGTQEVVSEYIEDDTMLFDYAIENLKVDVKSPYRYQVGERFFMHHVLGRIFAATEHSEVIANLFYLYIIIKIRIRKECVQLNMRIGLANYNEYLSKFDIEKQLEDGDKEKLTYIADTCLRSSNDYLEYRASVRALKHIEDQYHDNLSLTGSLYKRAKKGQRTEMKFSNLRSDLNTLVRAFLECLSSNQNKLHGEFRNYEVKYNPIVALDTAGSDLQAGPEVIAPFLRYMHYKGLDNFTYHISEDFMDVMDGLRVLEELLVFTRGISGLRLGHASALGVDVKRFYTKRKRNILCTRQCLLDNLVWLYGWCKKLNLEIPAFVTDDTIRLYSEIYDNNEFDIEMYWHSMYLRGDLSNSGYLTDAPEEVFLCQSEECKNAREKAKAKEYYNEYLKTNDKADIYVLYRLPMEAISIISDIKKSLLALVQDRQIESCPSSNLVIGPFKLYKDTPVFEFYKNGINVSVNTDTKGIFATSLNYEYSLIACSLFKSTHNKEEILDTISKLIDNNKSQRFTIPKIDSMIGYVN